MNQKNSLYKERLKNLLESSMGKKILEFLENDDVVEIMLNTNIKSINPARIIFCDSSNLFFFKILL